MILFLGNIVGKEFTNELKNPIQQVIYISLALLDFKPEELKRFRKLWILLDADQKPESKFVIRTIKTFKIEISNVNIESRKLVTSLIQKSRLIFLNKIPHVFSEELMTKKIALYTLFVDENILKFSKFLSDYKIFTYKKDTIFWHKYASKYIEILNTLAKYESQKKQKATADLNEIDKHLKSKLLLPICAPQIYSNLLNHLNQSDVSQKYFILNAREELFLEILDLVRKDKLDYYFCSEYDDFPKSLNKDYSGIALQDLQKAKNKLYEIRPTLTKWDGYNQNKFIILHGDDKSYSAFKNLNFFKIDLSEEKFFAHSKTGIFIHLYLKYHPEFYNPYLATAVKNNTFDNLLSEIVTHEDLEQFIKLKSIRAHDDTIDNSEFWYHRYLLSKKSISLKEVSKPTPPQKIIDIYFIHSDGYWDIKSPQLKLKSEGKYKYSDNLGIKYLIFLCKKTSPAQKMKAKEIVEIVGKWHKKQIAMGKAESKNVTKNSSSTKIKENEPLNTRSERDPDAHRIDSNLRVIADKIPQLEQIRKKIKLDVNCYYNIDEGDELLNVNVKDDEFERLTC